jgi:hypothetical protein
LAQVRNILIARYDVMRSRADTARNLGPVSSSTSAATAPASAAASAAAPAATALATAPTAPDTAGIADAFAAAAPTPATTPASAAQSLFHGLFQDTDRPAPIASAISSLWTSPLASAAEVGAAKPARGSSSMIDLFKDSGQSS